MEKLNEIDLKLIEKAKEVIKKNYDGINYNHTVGAALLAKSGKIYVGVNVYSLHGICAEQTALSSAITCGEREFLTIVAINGENGDVISPCGNCRQMLVDYMPLGDVIINDNNELIKIKVKDLIPYAYHAKY